MRHLRSLALLAAVLVFVSGMPAVAQQARTIDTLWDFRVENVRAAVGEADEFARNGYFPEPGKDIWIYVRIAVYESASTGVSGASSSSFEFDASKAGRPESGRPVTLVLLDAATGDALTNVAGGSCLRIQSIPAGGREIALRWQVKDASQTDIVAHINRKCDANDNQQAGYYAYAEQPGTAEDASNKKTLSVVTGKIPNFAIRDTLCYDTACTSRAFGPGNALTPTGATVVRMENATYPCREDRFLFQRDPDQPDSSYNSSDRTCVHLGPSQLRIGTSPGVEVVHFRVNVSNIGTWDTSVAEPTSDVKTGTHSGERYLVYPPPIGETPTPATAKPIRIPIRFEVVKYEGTGEARTARVVEELSLAHYSGHGITANCDTAAPRNCAQWLWLPGSTTRPVHTPVQTTSFDLFRMGGDFELRTILNGGEDCLDRSDLANQRAPDETCADNVGVFPFRVLAPDLVTVLNTTLDVDGFGFQDLYSAGAVVKFRGYVENQGTAPTSMPVGDVPSNQLPGGKTQPARRVNTTFHVDAEQKSGAFTWTSRPVLGGGQCPAPPASCHPDDVPGALRLGPGERRYFQVTYTLAESPGTRIVRVVTDPLRAPHPLTGTAAEIDELNNDAEHAILIEDKIAPVLADPRVLDDLGVQVAGNPPEVARGEALAFLVNLTDTDHSITDVQLALTRPDGTAYTCEPASECTLTQRSRTGNLMSYRADLPDGLLELGDWKWKVNARDPAGNAASSVEKTLRVTSWKKSLDFERLPPPAGGQYHRDADFVTTAMPANGSIVRYAPPGAVYEPAVKVRWSLPGDPRGETGASPAWSSAPFTVRVTRPNLTWTDYTIVGEDRLKTVESWGTTNEYTSQFDDPDTPWVDKYNFSGAKWDQCRETAAGKCVRYANDTDFRMPFSVNVNEIGLWNVSVNVTDVGGASRVYWTTFRVRDELPRAFFTLGTQQWAAPGQTLNLSIRAKDDQGFGESGQVRLNLTHALSNVTTNVSATRVGECTQEDVDTVCTYEAHLKVGRSNESAQITRAGRWNLVVWTMDKHGNWNSTTTDHVSGTELPRHAAYVQVNDTLAPRLVNFGTSQPEEEVGANVTFWARAFDDTDVDVLLTARDGTTVLFERVLMEDEDHDGNWTFTTSFDRPRLVEYQVFLNDSSGARSLIASAERSIRISENLPPRVEVVSPVSVPDAGYFAKAAPTLEFRVYDTAQGVSSTSVKLRVGDEEVTTLERTPTDGGRGFLVRHAHDPARPFLHGQVVNVTIEAADLSDPPKPVTLNLTFKVDAIPPKSRILSFEPKHVGRDGDVWNVSLATIFTPESTDADDQLPTRTKEIRYQFLRNGPGRMFTYNGTAFPMSDLPAAQNVGNGEYFVRVLGVDEVGNVEVGTSQNTLQVYLDQVPPELVRARLKTTGRTVNATFEDQGAGVKSARMHYRYDGGAFSTIDMVRAPGGTWTATVPVRADARTVSYFLEATDNVGNRKQFGDETSPPWSFPIANRPPTIQVLAPENGARVSGQVTLAWQASDPDGDPLTYKVYYRPASAGDELELITLTSPTSSYVVDTARVGSGRDGLYDFRITASDGHFFEEASVRLDVQNSRDAIGAVSANKKTAAPGDTICYSARVTKQGASVVEARFFRGDERVAVVALNDQGRDCDVRAGDGVWSGSLVMDSAGTYDVEVYVKYVEAGEVKEATTREDRSFEVKLSAADVFKGNVGLVGAVAALAAAVLGLGAFATFRRWKR